MLGPQSKYSFPKNKIKILLLEKISQSAIDIFVKDGFLVETVAALDEKELISKIKETHCIGIRSKTKLTKEVLSHATKLLAIGAFCIGTDQIDLSAASEIGAPVFNAPFANTRSVAELVIAMMITLARQMGDRSKECHQGIWNKNSSGCYEVRGKTLCIIGYGHVGSQLSVLSESMGMKVQFFDVAPKLSMGMAEPKDSLESAISGADFVSLHVPGTPETAKLIGAKEIQLMKKGSFLINASRGNVVDLEALAAALRSKHLGGAAVDVFPYEPMGSKEEFKCELRGMDNVILTPHIGGSTEEAQVAIGREVASKLVSFINSGTTVGSVNFPEIQLPPNPKTHRILNVHHNQPGFLRDINTALADYNISAQMLLTSGKIGYLVVDVDTTVSEEVKVIVHKINGSIKTRVLF